MQVQAEAELLGQRSRQLLADGKGPPLFRVAAARQHGEVVKDALGDGGAEKRQHLLLGLPSACGLTAFDVGDGVRSLSEQPPEPVYVLYLLLARAADLKRFEVRVLAVEIRVAEFVVQAQNVPRQGRGGQEESPLV